MQVTEENCKELLYNWANDKYTDKVVVPVNEFPYEHVDDPELEFKNVMEWFILEWKNPSTGKTLLREFVETVPMAEDMKNKMLQMESIIFGDFRILEKNDNIIKVKDEATGNIYKTCGISTFAETDEEIFQRTGFIMPSMVPEMTEMFFQKEIERYEDIIIRPNSTITSILNKYPAEWVNSICERIGVDTKLYKKDKVKEIALDLDSPAKLEEIIRTFNPQSIDVLKLIMKNNGCVKCHKLKKFSDDIKWNWSDKIESDIGILRVHGLIYIGKMAFGGRLWKTALIPGELHDALWCVLKKNKN